MPSRPCALARDSEFGITVEGAMTIITRRGSIRRVLYATLGVLSVALGIIGVFVPGMPTTVFVIAASYLFAHSSPTLERWLERTGGWDHRFAGSRRRGACHSRAKRLR